MTVLDTVSDFISYLEKKEDLFRRMLFVGAAGEEELLAAYLGKINDKGEHDFIFPDDLNAVVLDEGFWEDFSLSPERNSQIEANKISYSWDALIEQFSTHIINDTQYIKDPLGPRSQEKVVRFLAREPRTRRRFLSRSLIELVENTPSTFKAVRIIAPSRPGDPYFVFLVLPHLSEISEEKYREGRRKLLESYCMVVKHDFPDAVDIIGIATEAGKDDYRSEDALYLDTRFWTPESEKEAISLKNDLGLLPARSKVFNKRI